MDTTAPHIAELDRQITALVGVIDSHGGEAEEWDAIRETARALLVSVGRMPFVINSAIAEGIVHRPRRGILANKKA